MEERDDLAAGRVNARQIRPLRGVASVAGQGEVRRIIGPAVLLGDDVFDAVGEASGFLPEQEVFAAVRSPLADKLSSRSVH
jgi:hypothetical protein